MRADWRRTESRTVRPFVSVNDCLSGVRLRLFSDAEFDDCVAFDATETSSNHFGPEFELGLDASAVESLSELTTADLSVVIRLADLRLRRSEIVLECGAGDLPQRWTLPDVVRHRFAWQFGVEATVALVLRHDRLPQAGVPFLRGHWLARKDFSVRAKSQPKAFPIERWTAEDFATRGLPRDTAYWIDFIAEGFNQRFDDPGEALRLCLRADVYDSLVQAQDSGPGKAVLSLLHSEIVAVLLWRGLKKLEPNEEIERGGVLWGILQRVQKATGQTKENLLRAVQNDEFPTVRAIAQAMLGTRKAVAKLSARFGEPCAM